MHTWTCPQVLGQPVQCIRMSLGKSRTDSRCSATRHPSSLVAMLLKPQNWFPVHETRPDMTLPGFGVNFCSKGSASKAWTY